MIRILVAEDFDLIREDLCDTLEQQEDMTVVGSAATGEAIPALALEHQQTEPQSLISILCDEFLYLIRELNVTHLF